MICEVAARPLVLFVGTHDNVSMPLLFAVILLIAFFSAPANFAAAAILGDVVDYDLMKSRVNKAGRFFALYILLVKVTMALGAGAALLLLDSSGYVVGGANGATANRGLLFCYLILPALCWIASTVLAWTFPITARRHAVIRKGLERQAAAALARG